MKIKLKGNNISNVIFGKIHKKPRTYKIVFYDYNGDVLYKYENIHDLTSLPTLPDRTSENLTCSGWNWSLDGIKEQLNSVGGVVNVGATYYTTDEKTHITCKPVKPYSKAYINLTPTVANAVTVNWGDGRTDTWTTTNNATKTHTYSNVTDSSVYDITISCSSGTYSFPDYITGAVNINPEVFYTGIKLSNKITNISTYAFNGLRLLDYLIIPNGVTGSIWLAGYSMKCFVVPNEITTCSGQSNYCKMVIASENVRSFSCNNAIGLKTVTIPNGVTSLGSYGFQNCCSLQSIDIPGSVTSIGDYCFQNCYSLQFVNILKGVATLNSSCFLSCVSLQSIIIPDTVTSMGSQCFSSCSSLMNIFMQPTTPPTLGSTNAIPTTQWLVIYVPRGTLSAYQSASNWSTYSSKMVEYDY